MDRKCSTKSDGADKVLGNPNHLKIKMEPSEENLNENETAFSAPDTNTEPLEASFKCEHCSEKFYSTSSLKEHSIVHNPSICNISFAQKKSNLRTYSRKPKKDVAPSAPILFKCEHCHEKFSAALELDRHMITHNSTICNITINPTSISTETGSIKTFKKEILDDTKPPIMNAYNESDSTISNIVITSTISLKCTKCEFFGSSKEQIEKHALLHDKKIDSMPYCKKCGFRCNTQFALNTHMIKHTMKNVHQCKSCKARFRYKNQLEYHTCEPKSKYPKLDVSTSNIYKLSTSMF